MAPGEAHAGGELLLIDSDVFVLLSAACLLDDAIAALGYSIVQARRLDALPSMLSGGKHFRDYDDCERARAMSNCDRVVPIRAVPDASLMQMFVDCERPIHGGEALLFSLAIEYGHIVATGDGNAMRSLAHCPPQIAKGLAGRLHCLEQILECLIARQGVPEVHALIARCVPRHKTLTLCFSDECLETEGGVLRRIQHYRKKLEGAMPAGCLRLLI